MNAGVFLFFAVPTLTLSRWRRTVKESVINKALTVIYPVGPRQ